MSELPHHLIRAHAQIAAAVRLYPRSAGWRQPLDWWQRVAMLAPALPLPLVADLGTLICDRHAHPNGKNDTYSALLRAFIATPALRAAQTLHLDDAAIAGLLAHLAQKAPVPADLRLRLGIKPVRIAAAIHTALTNMPPAAQSDWLPSAALCAHLLARLRALTPAAIRLLHEASPGVRTTTDRTDLRALTNLLTLATHEPDLLNEVLAFLPALAEPAADSTGVPAAWALPDELLAYDDGRPKRLTTPPPAQPTTLFVLLVQGSAAMTGDALVLGLRAADERR